jgi:hypothetical protein
VPNRTLPPRNATGVLSNTWWVATRENECICQTQNVFRGMSAPGIVHGADLELLCVNRSDGLVNGPLLIKDQQGPQQTLAPQIV